ncbi:uncharacterized protein DMAD_09890 [Drosophila madeirensis]|uniref:Uncharacterized protein n=1 Tax=Drosophila madeirensis TaxID=30013 RepID=A0AAU9EXF3_DROMD
MSKVMCPWSLIESEVFIQVLKKETDEYFSILSEKSSSLLSSADCLTKSSNTDLSKKIVSLLEDEDVISLYMECSAHYYKWKTIINAYAKGLKNIFVGLAKLDKVKKGLA